MGDSKSTAWESGAAVAGCQGAGTRQWGAWQAETCRALHKKETKIQPGGYHAQKVEPTPAVHKIGLLIPPEAQAPHLQDHLKRVQHTAEYDRPGATARVSMRGIKLRVRRAALARAQSQQTVCLRSPIGHIRLSGALLWLWPDNRLRRRRGQLASGSAMRREAGRRLCARARASPSGRY
jgi:hypothetical protein